MNKKTSKLLTSLAVGVAAYYVYNQFVAPASTAGLGNWRRRQRGQGWGGGTDNTMPDTFGPYGGGGYNGGGWNEGGGWGSGYSNNYDPRITEQTGGLAYQNAMLDAMESGN